MKWYLAGKMGGRLGGPVLDERRLATDLLDYVGVEVYDPAENENIRRDEIIDLRMDEKTMKSFVSKDEYAIRHCDGLLVLTGDTPSEGTGLEFGLALELKKPVVVVSPKRASGELMGFWNIKASAVVPTIEEAAKFISENYF